MRLNECADELLRWIGGSLAPGTMIVSARASAARPCGRLEDEPGLRPHAALAGRDDEHSVPGVGDVATVDAEHLAWDREVERRRAPRRSTDGDRMHGAKISEGCLRVQKRRHWQASTHG